MDYSLSYGKLTTTKILNFKVKAKKKEVLIVEKVNSVKILY